MPNALAGETSPYLLQHKDNPVDWRPWSAAAFAEARRRDVPVFLSVGYATCYWCHVMEREVFENATLAKQMNDGFVCIKVDREQRPDLDEHYMAATQVISGQGGWPMSVFLTPDGAPFYAGTYFPPTDAPPHQGRPGFGTLMTAMTEAWRDKRGEVMQTVENVTDVLRRIAEPRPPTHDVTFERGLFDKLTAEAASDYEPVHGGFGRAPKFPRQTLLAFLLQTSGQEGKLRHTLDAMADGGIRDHLGGGFHRYSTDSKWLVPHFEIMLYDQAMLAPVYAHAAAKLSEPRFEQVARRCLDFVLREMTSPDGVFYTALDAEVDGSEGKNYLWTPDDVRDVLGDDADRFNAIYGLDRGFNFADPHGPNPTSPDTNVLYLAEPAAEDEAAAWRDRLLVARGERKQPILDDKIITSWNGLMIEALATCGDLLNEPRYRDAATRAARWLLDHHATKTLVRTSRDGAAGPDATLDDYAHFGAGLLACGMTDEADLLADAMLERFTVDGVAGRALALTAADDPDVVLMSGIRRRTAGDTPLPSGNGSAALLLVNLGRTNDARKIVRTFADQITDQPGHASTLARAARAVVAEGGNFEVKGSEGPAQLPSVDDEAGRVVSLTGEWIDERQVDVVLEIQGGFHLYAPNHDGQERVVELSATDTSKLAHVDYPQSAEGKLVGRVRLSAHLIEPMSPGGQLELALAYQACDESRCLPAVRKIFVIRLADAASNGSA